MSRNLASKKNRGLSLDFAISETKEKEQEKSGSTRRECRVRKFRTQQSS